MFLGPGKLKFNLQQPLLLFFEFSLQIVDTFIIFLGSLRIYSHLRIERHGYFTIIIPYIPKASSHSSPFSMCAAQFICCFLLVTKKL